MKIRDLITQDKATLSFEVFPPKKDTDFADVEAAALGIAAFKPDYMSVTYGAGGEAPRDIRSSLHGRSRRSTTCRP